MKTLAHRLAPVAALGLALSALTGCSSAADGGDEQHIETLRVGMVALGQLPVDQAKNEGYFTGALEGTEIEYVTYPSGAAAIPALIAGDVDIVYTNNVSAGLAISQDFDLKLVSGADSISANNQQVVVPKGSDVTDVADLDGKTVSVNALQSLGWLGIQVALRDADINPADVTFTEVSFPEAVAVMERGDVVAAQVPQPYAETAVAAGTATKLFDFNDYEELADLPIGSFYTTGAWATSHPGAVTSFREGVNKAMEDLSGDVDLVAQLTEAAAGATPDVAAIIAASIQYVPNQAPEQTQRVFDLMSEFDMLDTPIDVANIAVGG